MYITCRIIFYLVKLGGILFIASYYNGYYACPHNNSIIIVILQAIIPYILSCLSRPMCPI
jgi:hypothetical protein